MSLPRLTLLGLLEAHFGDPDAIQETKDFRAVFLDGDQGRRVLATIAQRSRWLQWSMPMSGTGVDSLAMAWEMGRRSIMDDIAEILDRDVERMANDGR